MLLEILEDLQLTHNKKSIQSEGEFDCQHVGQITMAQLSSATREKFERYKHGDVIASYNIGPIPNYIYARPTDNALCQGVDDSFAKRGRLSSGDDSDYGGDTSAADFGFACSLLQEGLSPEEVESVMRATRYRVKFDQLRGQNTYLARTIAAAVEVVSRENQVQKNDVPKIEQSLLLLERGRLSIPSTPPPRRDYVWLGRIVAGHVYVLGGFGGVSKSQAALQLAASVALGAKFGGIGTSQGCALLIFGEDDSSEIERRLGAYAAADQLTAEQRAELEMYMRAIGMSGEDTRLTELRGGALMSTVFAEKIIGAANKLVEQSCVPVRLIVLDHAGLFHGGDFNAREDVSLTMRIVNHIAKQTGAAVLLLAHSPKAAGASETSEASAIAGSTTFVDQTRGAFILATMRPNEAKALGIDNSMRQQYVSLAVVKNNYGKTGESSWFTRTSPPGWEVGVLSHTNLLPPIKSTAPNASASARVKQFVTEHPGQYSKSSLRDSKSGKTGALKASKQEVAAAIEDLLSTGGLITRSPTVDERKKFGLSQQTTVVLDVAARVC